MIRAYDEYYSKPKIIQYNERNMNASLYLNIHLISDFGKQTLSYNWYWKHHILIADRRKYKLSEI